MFNFSITDVFPGSEKQKAVGIYATFNMEISSNEGVVVALRDLKLNKSKKDGKYFIGSPYREYTSKGENQAEESKKIHFIKLWPEQKNWDKQDEIVNLVINAIKSAKPSNPAPASKPAPAATTSAKPKTTTVTDDW